MPITLQVNFSFDCRHLDRLQVNVIFRSTSCLNKQSYCNLIDCTPCVKPPELHLSGCCFPWKPFYPFTGCKMSNEGAKEIIAETSSHDIGQLVRTKCFTGDIEEVGSIVFDMICFFLLSLLADMHTSPSMVIYIRS